MIIANWKMNGTRQSVATWIEDVSNNINIKNVNPCVFCPPNCYLEYARRLIDENGYHIEIGSQIVNHSSEDESLTGGISTTMLKDLSVEYVLVGHSEQRNFLMESNNVITKKIEKALEDELSVIYCIGEDIDTKNKNETYSFLSEQLDVFSQLQITHEDKLRSITVAYEPIWAIGSGLNAEKDYIEETHEFIKKYINDHLEWGQLDIYPAVLYGGSVNLENCEEIISSNDVDGLLIGGASLNSETFSKIYNLS
jgi:triosephosphate isomerase